jgi:cell division protein FtsN
MPADNPREPRFDTTPAPRLGPADPLRPGQTPPPEPPVAGEPEGGVPPLSPAKIAAGIMVALALVGGIVYAAHREPTPAVPPAPAPAAPAPAPEPSAPAPAPVLETPPPAAPAPPPAVTPAPAPAQVARPSPAPAAANRPTAHAHGKPAVAVPQDGPKHRRRTVETSGDWLVQAGAYHSRDSARAVAETLVKHGWPAHAIQGHGDWFLVEVTGYKTRSEADSAATRLAGKEHVPTLVRQVKRKAPG